MENDSRNIMPGDRVMVFDSSVFKDDITTPLSMTMQSGTVVCRYGTKNKAIDQEGYWYYPDIVDVIFDHRSEHVSHGHFTNGVEVMGGYELSVAIYC